MSLFERALGSLATGHGLSGHGKPPDLQPWAAERGLVFEGVRAVPGVYLGLGMDADSITNVISGELPGGELGAIAHEKVVAGSHAGSAGGARVTNYAAHTKIAVRVPEAVGALQRFEISNATLTKHLRPDADVADQRVKMAELGFGGGMGWAMTASRAADMGMVQQLLSGDFGARLAELPGRFVLELGHGSLILDCADGYHGATQLELRCQHLCYVAQVLRQACFAAAPSKPFETELPAPGWVADPPAGPTAAQGAAAFATGLLKHMTIGDNSDQGASAIGLDQPLAGPWRDLAIGLEQQWSPAKLEDALAFHRAFPAIPIPGNAFCVLRNPDPEAGMGRIAFYNEGVITHGPVAVIFPVKASAPDRPAPIGGERDALRIAIKDGLLAAWMYRSESWDASQYYPMVNAAWDHAKSEGWVPA